MKFIDAKNRLKELAKGRYHSLYYDLTEYHTGELKAECRLYIAQMGSATAPTWEEAFTAFERKTNPHVFIPEEMPDEDTFCGCLVEHTCGHIVKDDWLDPVADSKDVEGT